MKFIKPKSLHIKNILFTIKNILFTYYKTDKFIEKYLDMSGKEFEKNISKLTY